MYILRASSITALSGLLWIPSVPNALWEM